jgi:hypothetical protein
MLQAPRQKSKEKGRYTMSDSITTSENATEIGDVTEISTTIPVSTSGPTIISKSAVDKMRDDRSLPKVPGMKPTIEELQVYLEALQPEAYNRLAMYVYRQYPIINRRMFDPDATVNIDFLSQDHVEENLRKYLIRVHGGGKYKILVNDVEKPSIKGTDKSTIMTVLVKIPFDEAMPILDFKELDMTAKENIGYVTTLKNQGVLDSKGNIMQPTNNNATADTAGVVGEMRGVVKDIMDRYEKMDDKQRSQMDKVIQKINPENGNKGKETDGVMSLFLERLKQDDPDKQMKTMLLLITAIKEMGASGDKDKGSSADKLIEIITKSHETQITMMNKMFELALSKNQVQQNSGDSFVDSLLKFAKVKESLPEFFGGQHNPAKPTTAEIVLDGIKEIGLPVVGLVSQLVQMRTGIKPIIPTSPQQAEEMVKEHQRGSDMRQPQIATTNTPTNQQTTQPNQTVQANPSNTSTYPPGTILDIETMQPIQDASKLTVCQKYLIQFGGMIANAIKSGTDGVDLAMNIKSMAAMMGQDYYAILKHEGKDKIIAAMKSVPEFWADTGGLLGEEKINEVIDDFINAEQIVADEEKEEQEGKGA